MNLYTILWNVYS